MSVHAYVCMVFIRLFGLFAVLFELCCRIIWITRPCAKSSGSTSTLRLAPPRHQRHRLILPPRLLQQLWDASTSSALPFYACVSRRPSPIVP
jgi:hypothetical protein